jgi:hypothetical protein
MTSQLVPRLEALEESMGAGDDQPQFKIEVVFIGSDGQVTGTRTLSVGKEEPGSGSH